MASPSQPPANSSTSRIIFASDFAQSTFSLVDIPKGLEKYIEDQETNLIFQLRGLEQDTAVLCTRDKTFSVQRAHTSNTLIPISSLYPDDEDALIEQRPWLNDGKGTASTEGNLQKQKTTIVAVDMLESTLELVPLAPRLDRLAELLGKALYEGRAQDAKAKAEMPRYTTEQLQSIVQASDMEIDAWLKQNHACQIDGYWRLLEPRYMFDILQEILLTMKVLEMSPDAVDCDRLISTILDGETDMESWLIQHILHSFSQDGETKSNDNVLVLSADKICGFLGTHLLASRERGSRWPYNDFMSTWRKLVHDHFPLSDLAPLAGHVLEERIGSGSNSQVYIRYFSKADLSSDPVARFKALFEAKPQWESREIRPFLRDLVTDEKKLDIMLMKHARGVKQSDGRVVYHSRIK
ncbi:hypothetical protein BGW41_000984 [Actinomortierella wolfii]|nr:hypothetical protein BGW41_000984 [Actinomortierella wolfii]